MGSQERTCQEGTHVYWTGQELSHKDQRQNRLANKIELELKMFPHERKLQQIQQQKLMVEQLRREASINRINVSQACKDLQKFCSDHQNEDFLLKGFASQKQNPFREKSSCTLL